MINTSASKLTELQRAQKIAAEFVTEHPPGSHYVYVYCGRATYDATKYEFIDGLALASERIWHLDESQTECVAYVGEGSKHRINKRQDHPVFPEDPALRIKLKDGLDKADSVQLEELLIAELKCVLDKKRPDGCLANIQYKHNGPRCCDYLEIFAYRLQQAQGSVDAIAFDADKNLIARGSTIGLSRLLQINQGAISNCILGKSNGAFSSNRNEPLHFCLAKDFDSYQVKSIQMNHQVAKKILIATHLTSGVICVGTAKEIREQYPAIKCPDSLHKVARGKNKHAYGWTCRYADDPFDNPIESPINLNAFF